MRGRVVAISLSRRLVIDFMRFTQEVPRATIMRRMHLARLVVARRNSAAAGRPMWTAIFAKAYGIVSDELPELRRAYVKFPRPHFYEYPQAVAMIPLARDYFGEESILTTRIKNPGTLPLSEVNQVLLRAKSVPADQVNHYGRMLRIARLPGPLRLALWWLALNIGRQRANYFGTFLISTVSRHGGEFESVLSPVSTSLSYGVIAPDGSVDVRLTWDHRVMDGLPAARALMRLEEILLGPVADELIGSLKRPALRVPAEGAEGI
jgi:hypothetical protein